MRVIHTDRIFTGFYVPVKNIRNAQIRLRSLGFNPTLHVGFMRNENSTCFIDYENNCLTITAPHEKVVQIYKTIIK